MSKLLDQAVTQAKDGTWGFVCPVNDGTCGVFGDNSKSFTSTEWPSRKVAMARGAEHFADHKGEGAMSSLDEFRKKHGLQVDAKGVVTAKDL